MDRSLRLLIMGDAAGAEKAFLSTSAAASAAADDIDSRYDKTTSKLGGLFSNLGQKMESFGLPGAAALTRMGSKMDEAEGHGQKLLSTMSAVGGLTFAAGAVGLVAFGAASVEGATKFQSAMEMIHTQAGASQAEVNKMTGAVLAMAGSVGQSPDELAAGLFHIESAGLHGAKALDVLRTAAEGAAVGHVSLEDAAALLGPVVNSNFKDVKDASDAMGMLNATVGAGDMHMQDLMDALVKVMPNAKTAGLSMRDLGSALATMGDLGMRGSTAGIYVRQAIMALVHPSGAAAAALNSIGLTTLQLSEDLHKPEGFLKAMEDLKSHLDAGIPSAVAQAADALNNLPPSLRGLGQQLIQGSISSKQFSADLQGLSPAQASLMNAFSKTVDAAAATGGGLQHVGNTILDTSQKANLLATALGGVKSSTGVELLLNNMDRLKSKYGDISAGEKNFGKDYEATTHTLQFQMDQAKASVEALSDRFGMFLIPKLEDVIHVVGDVVGWFEHHKAAAIALAAVIAGPLVASMVVWAAEMVGNVGGAIASTTSKLLNLGTTMRTAAGMTEEEAEVNDQLSSTLADLNGTISSLTEQLNAQSAAYGKQDEIVTQATRTQLVIADAERATTEASQVLFQATLALNSELSVGEERLLAAAAATDALAEQTTYSGDVVRMTMSQVETAVSAATTEIIEGSGQAGAALDRLGIQAETAGASVSGAASGMGASMERAGVTEAATTAEGALSGVGEAAGSILGPLGVVAGTVLPALALGFLHLGQSGPNAVQQTANAVQQLDRQLAQMPTDTPNDLVLAMDAAARQIGELSGKMAGTTPGSSQFDIDAAKIQRLQEETEQWREKLDNTRATTAELAHAFGVTAQTVQSVAAGFSPSEFNLAGRLDPTQIKVFASALKQMDPTWTNEAAKAQGWATTVANSANAAAAAARQGDAGITTAHRVAMELGLITLGTGGAKALAAFVNAQQGGLPAVKAAANEWGVKIPLGYLEELEVAMDAHGKISMKKLADAMAQNSAQVGTSIGPMFGATGQQLQVLTEQFRMAGVRSPQQMALAIMGGAPNLTSSGKQVMAQLLTELNSHQIDAKQAGLMISLGMADGITSGSSAVANAAAQTVLNALKALNATSESKSPSRLFAREGGVPIAQGVALGISSSMGLAEQAMRQGVQQVLNATNTGGAGGAGGGVGVAASGVNAGPSARTVNFNATINVQGVTDPNAVAQQVRTTLLQSARALGPGGLWGGW